MIHIEDFIFNGFQERCCVIWDEEGKCAVTDPGCSDASEYAELSGFIRSKGLTPVAVMLTHGHIDHMAGIAYLLDDFGEITVYMDSKERFTLENNDIYCKLFGMEMPRSFNTTDIEEGTIIRVGGLEFEVIKTPGHTVGGVCYLERKEKVIFCGDTLFAGAIGRTDLPGGDYDVLMDSIFRKLMILDGDIRVIPGHGPETDIAAERTTNPFLMPFNEPLED